MKTMQHNITDQKGPILHSSGSMFRKLFSRDNGHGVSRINIYLLRLLFVLVFVFVSYDSWVYIINFKGSWDPVRAAAFCMWAAYALLSFIGIFYPLKMLPLVLFEIIYKIIWLIIVAFPLWTTGQMEGSSAEGMAFAFSLVILPIIAMPWRYAFNYFILNNKKV